MQTVTIDSKWDHEIVLGDDLISYLKKNNIKSVALFASVQFLDVTTVQKQLKGLNIIWKTTKAKRTNADMQILGCDAYHDSFEVDIISQTDATLYIGDGMFHPKALLLSQIYSKKELKPVVIWNPVLNEMQIITVQDIQAQIDGLLANLKRFIGSKTIGILVTVKPGQQYLNNALKLKDMLEKQGKKAYIFIDDDIQLFLLENYPFIDAWVNTACPRIGTDDHVTIRKPLINIREAYDPVAAIGKLIK
ncbi:MAG TPA: diphthamide synthesis protein [Acidobacteriota bacterium]|nr:diphthamide synthesis protein [Acidobacteriota bacterium]